MSRTAGPKSLASLVSLMEYVLFYLFIIKNLKGHAILNVLRSFFRAIKAPSIVQLWLFICSFLRTHIWSSSFLGNRVLQGMITAIQRVNETMHCRQSWWP